MSVTSPTVFLIRVLFELLANSNRPFPFPPIPPTNAQKQRISKAWSKFTTLENRGLRS